MTKTGKKDPAITFADIISGTPFPAKSLYVLTGDDSYAFSELEKIFIKKFLSDDPSFTNLHKFDCSAATKASAIVNLCEEYPFGTQYKLIICKDAQDLSSKEGEKLKRYLQDPSPSSVLVLFELEGEYRQGGSGKFSPARELKDAIKKFGLHIPCKLGLSQVREWARSKFAVLGKRANPDALELLIEMTGLVLWDIKQEIEKIVLFTGKKDIITVEDVKAVVSHKPQSKIFNLSEHVGMKKISAALFVLNELLKEKVIGVQILATLSNHFTFLWKLRSLSEQGLNEDEISRKLHKHSFYIKKSLSQVRNFNRESFETVFDLIARTDGALKSGIDESRALELMIIQICRLKS